MNITQKENQHVQRFASFHVRYRSSDNNIQCFDTTQYCRMTHCSITPHHPIFCSTELRPCRYCSHSHKTTVKGNAVPLNTIKTFTTRTVTTAPICNVSTKYR